MTEGELKKRLNVILTDDNLINKTLDAAKKEFPIHFKYDTVSGGEYDANTDSFTPQIVTTEILDDLPLPKYQANAFVDKDEIIKWYLKWFGDEK